jgi:uncharacterized membrane protein
MEEIQKPRRKSFWGTLWRQFFTGILTIIPLAITVLVLRYVFETVDNVLNPAVVWIFGRQIPGLGFVATIILIYLAGVVASNIFGKRLIRWVESLIGKIPVIKQLYGGIRDITDSLHNVGQAPFLQVVLVEWPRPGMRTLAFVTKEITDKNGKKLLIVLIPSVPNPVGGFLEIVHEENVVHTDISVNDALKLMLSMGKVVPQDIEHKLTEVENNLAK